VICSLNHRTNRRCSTAHDCVAKWGKKAEPDDSRPNLEDEDFDVQEVEGEAEEGNVLRDVNLGPVGKVFSGYTKFRDSRVSNIGFGAIGGTFQHGLRERGPGGFPLVGEEPVDVVVDSIEVGDVGSIFR